MHYFLGTIQRVQIQRSPMKSGEGETRAYRLEPLLVVDALRLTKDGVFGQMMDGAEIMDVHHMSHPQTRYRGDNPVSLNFTGHYAHMRSYFGDHMGNGSAAENILIDADGLFTLADIGDEIMIVRSHDGAKIMLNKLMPAPPCAPFAVFAAQKPVTGSALREALQFLDAGVRGFYGHIASPSAAVIQPGDHVFAARS